MMKELDIMDADTEAEEMEALETRLLNQLAYPDPYSQDEQ